MKKLLTTIFAVILACSASANAQDEAIEAIPFTLTAPTMSVGVGSTFTVPLTMSDITGDGIISFQFDVVFDHNFLATSGTNFGCNSPAGTIAGNAGFFVVCNVPAGDPGRLKVAAFGSAVNLSGSGTLMNLTFTANVSAPSASVSPLNFENDMFFSNAFPSVPGIPHTSVNGQVTIFGTTAAPTTVSGQILTRDGSPVRNARISLTDSNGKQYFDGTKRSGYFSIRNVPAGASYIVNVTAKGYTFAPSFLQVNDSISGLIIHPN